ncbi:MAG: hypothetical protein FWG98_06170 [Candidatus Cloacimonetes bacterium]|nr:hypothetical protein [Candidatus Cloacimonadota bacterium]
MKKNQIKLKRNLIIKKTLNTVFWVSLLLIVSFSSYLFTGCGNKGNDVSSYSSNELTILGWQAFQNGNFAEAERYFNELTKREDAYLVGHGGLGWTFLRTYKYQNAKNEFNKFFTLDSLGVYPPTDSLTRDVRAGQVFVHSALSEHSVVITSSQGFTANNATNNNWRFRYDRNITVVDVRLLRAASQVSMKNFTDAYTMVRLIEPSFETDLNTVEGRLMLVMKIEELIEMRR